MFQPFVIYCLIGLPQTFDNCQAEVQPAVYPTEEICYQALYSFVTEVLDLNDNYYKGYEIVNLGCNSYLREKANI